MEIRISIGASGPLAVRDLAKLFAVAATPGYKQADLLAHLSK